VIHFYDSSALAKRYMREAGSERVEALYFGSDQNAVSVITRTEIACALARQIIDPGTHLEQLHRDLERSIQIEITPEVAADSVTLGVKYRLRGCDALQLATAVGLKKATGRPVRFICADEDLNVAARAEGLDVLDPGRAT
jgi:predicted nucleic acid-binding protein